MLNIIGQIAGTSGYSMHTKQLALALSKLTDVRLSTTLPTGYESMLSDRELMLLKVKPEPKEDTLIISFPTTWRMHLGHGRNIGYLVWEGSSVPECFITEIENESINAVIVPSEHVRDAIKVTAESRWGSIKDKINVIPHGHDPNLFFSTDKPKDKCVFVANKGWRNLQDRGGIQYLLKAYIEEFTKDDKVELLIKLNPAYGIPNINQLIQDLNLPKKEGGPVIIFNTQNLPDAHLHRVYNSGNVFVSPTRAEAFNIPCLEAMACGLPVITTNFGGQTDFVNEMNGWLIGGDLTEVEHEVMYEGIKWLTPSVDELKRALRHAYDHQDEVKFKGNVARVAAGYYTWDRTAQEVITLLTSPPQIPQVLVPTSSG